MSGRTTLKSYFLTGATPTEAQFADLIDSVLVLSEDIVGTLDSTSTVRALSAGAGKTLSDLITSVSTRVTTLENAEATFQSNYYTKSEVDSSISIVNAELANKAYASAVTDVATDVAALQVSIGGKSSLGHIHLVSDITGLQDALDLKAAKSYVDSQVATLNTAIGNIVPSDETTDVSNLQSQIDTINASLSNYALVASLSSKADTSHTHTVADISDISSNYYDKSSVDTLLDNVEPKDHTHIESDITDLDKYTQAQTDLVVSDHSNLTNNPHSVTKDQVGLGNVENLSSVSLFNSSAAQSAFASSVAHEGSVSNPHSVTKAQVGLSNVPDIDVKALLDAHEAASNPHNINLSFFDVYSRAETDTRVQHYIDTLRYAYTPSSPTDSSGSIGDFAYDSSNLYFKTSATNWLTLSGGGGSSGGAITGTSLNIGSGLFNVTSGASASTDINTPSLVIADNMVLLNKNQTGTPLSALEGGLEIERGNYQNAKIYWQESSSKWKCNLGGQIKTIVFQEDISPLTSTTDLTANVIAAPTSWSSNKPTAYFSYTVTNGMVTIQWYLDGSNTNEPLTALNNDQIYYPLPSAIAFNRENTQHVIRVPMSVRTGMTTTNATAFGDAFVDIHNSTTRIGMRFWGINNVTSSNYWSASGQITYPI